MKIGLIGVGMVGGAVKKALEHHHTLGFHKYHVSAYDKNGKYGKFEDTLDTEVMFVCLPTPTNKHWEQDLTAIYDVFEKLNKSKYAGEIILKSTVLPGTCDSLSARYPNLTIVHNPEFLRANHAYEDFINQPSVLLSSKQHPKKSFELYKKLVGRGIPVYVSQKYTDTEGAKYLHNTFLATKLIFMNEYAAFCDKLGMDYKTISKFAATANGIGHGHLSVPGPDGKPGFGGMCFPKDTKALLKMVNQYGLRFHTLGAAVEHNKTLRPEEM